MKKLFLTILAVILAFNCLSGCKNENTINVYTPDGAPAIALTPAMKENYENFKFNVVDRQPLTIGTFVTGEDKKADICVLPINMASNLIGDGENYKLIGTITHGNFYLLSKSDKLITPDNLADLVGLTIGVIQLKNIPGLTFKSVLLEKNIPYNEISKPQNATDDQVNLIGISATEIGVDYIDAFLVPSPEADLKAKDKHLNFIASLQELYGENGFPQAVIVAKNSLIENNAKTVKDFITLLKDENHFITESNIENICSLISENLTEGLTPTFTSKNLTFKMIERSSIKFTSVKENKQEIIDFITRIQKVDAKSVKPFKDSFLDYE